MNKNCDHPIGVFDSGLGGLTVVKELIRHLPNERNGIAASKEMKAFGFLAVANAVYPPVMSAVRPGHVQFARGTTVDPYSKESELET